MATASRVESSSLPSDGRSAETIKYPIKRLEISIKKFIKVLSIDLDRLQKHSVNLKRFTNAEDWQGLHREQVNATRTVQQIKANIREIEKARNQVSDEDQQEFDNRVSEVKTKAVMALEEFIVLMDGEAASSEVATTAVKNQGRSTETGTGDFQPQSLSSSHISLSSVSPPPPSALFLSSSSPPSSSSRNTAVMSQSTYETTHPSTQAEGVSHHNIDDQASEFMSLDTAMASTDNDTPSLQTQTQMLTTNLHVMPQNSEASASFEQLRESIDELNDLVHVFAENVHEQQEAIDRIEDNIDSAHINVQEGTSYLAKASKYKAAMFPAVGAVIGGVIGGPIGLVAGAKLGGLAVGIGGAVGFAGGRYMKKRQTRITDMEMAKMSYSMYIPDLSDDETSGNNADASSNQTTANAPEEECFTNEINGSESQDQEKNFSSTVKNWFGFGDRK